MILRTLRVMLHTSALDSLNRTTTELSKRGLLFTWITRGTNRVSLDCARRVATGQQGCGWGLSRSCCSPLRSVCSGSAGLWGCVSLPTSIPSRPLLMKPGAETQLPEPVQKVAGLGHQITGTWKWDTRLAWLPLEAGPVRSREGGGQRCLASQKTV